MKLSRRSRWLAVAAVLCAASTNAWTISSMPSTDAEPLATTWTVTGEGVLDAIAVQSMGRVFVDYDASLAAGSSSSVVARVVVRGDNRALLDAIEVVDDSAHHGLRIRFQNDAFEGQGSLLTQVFVASKRALRNVTMAWSSDIIVGSDVLVENDRAATVGLKLVGSGDLYAGSDSVELSWGAVGVVLAGSGDVQLLAKSLALANTMEINLTGSGDIGVVADEAITVANTLSSLIAGSGDVFVQSSNFTAFNLTSTVAGSGDITYSHDGSCTTQTVVVVGSGDVSTASIACTSTFVNLVGSGDILVQTTENLTVATFFVGDVRYYGATPHSITASSIFDYGASHKHSHEVVRKAKKNSYHEYEVKSTPARKPVYIVVKTSQDSENDEPVLHYALELETFDELVVRQFLSQQQQLTTSKSSISWISLLAGVGAACLVGVAVLQHVTAQRRGAYHAL